MHSHRRCSARKERNETLHLSIYLPSSVHAPIQREQSQMQRQTFQRLIFNMQGIQRSGSAFALHVKGPGFDPRYLQMIFFTFSCSKDASQNCPTGFSIFATKRCKINQEIFLTSLCPGRTNVFFFFFKTFLCQVFCKRSGYCFQLWKRLYS